MCENLVLFCLSCKTDIYSYNTPSKSPSRKGKEKGDGGHSFEVCC